MNDQCDIRENFFCDDDNKELGRKIMDAYEKKFNYGMFFGHTLVKLYVPSKELITMKTKPWSDEKCDYCQEMLVELETKKQEFVEKYNNLHPEEKYYQVKINETEFVSVKLPVFDSRNKIILVPTEFVLNDTIPEVSDIKFLWPNFSRIDPNVTIMKISW